jgi:hypothetical protein
MSPTRRGWTLMWLGMLAVLAAAGFAWIWLTTPVRAGFDALMYTSFALEYSGETFAAATEGARQVFAEHADPAEIARIGWPWSGFDDPTRDRWVGIYRMRPAYPLIVAALWFPLNDAAPMAVAFLSVFGLTAALGLGLPALVGYRITVIMLLLMYLNPFFGRWLVFLQTDGLGLALFAAAFVAGACYLAAARAYWLVVMLCAATLLAFTRQTGVLLPLTFGATAIVVCLADRTSARRAATVAGLGLVPLAFFSAYTALAGLPSFADMLQDIPTRHFLLPDVANPLQELVVQNRRQVPTLFRSLLADGPLLAFCAAALVVGFGGLLTLRGTWRIAFIILPIVTPVLYLVHPSYSELERTLAPIWFSLSLGAAALVVAAWDIVRVRLVGTPVAESESAP